MTVTTHNLVARVSIKAGYRRFAAAYHAPCRRPLALSKTILIGQ